jgi:hypothetical protein
VRNKRPSNPIDEKKMSQQKTKAKEKRKGNERKKKGMLDSYQSFNDETISIIKKILIR